MEEIERLGIEDFFREFQYKISDRHFRRIMRGVLNRGGGSEGIDPLEAYLRPSRKSDSLEKKPLPLEAGIKADEGMDALKVACDAVERVEAPTARAKAWLWSEGFRNFERGLADGRPAHKWKTAILDFLFDHAPGLASSPESLRRIWNRDFTHWQEKGRTVECLLDGRFQSRKKPLDPADATTIEAAVHFGSGGRYAQGVRLAIEKGTLSESYTSRFTTNPARAWDVPKKVRQELRGRHRPMQNRIRGPRNAKIKGASTRRDWTPEHAGDWYQMDDFTMPICYWVETADGPVLMRGQVILCIDVVSRKILGYLFVDERNYNARAIKRLMKKVCKEHGLPRCGWYFEGGIWERSKLIKGIERGAKIAEVLSGFALFNLEFRHAQTPGSKPIERTGGILQNYMEGLVGYVGRNEMVDKYEAVQKAKIKAAKTHPSTLGFMAADQWMQILNQICDEYNERPLGSPATRGLCPNDAWERFHTACQRTKLPPELYYLFDHATEKTISRQGVEVDFGKYVEISYRNEYTGSHVGERVLVHSDEDDFETVTITDLNRKNPVVIPREPNTPAMTASREQLRAARGSVRSHERPLDVRFGQLKKAWETQYRTVMAAQSNLDYSKSVQTQKAQLKQRAEDRAKRDREFKRDLVGVVSDPEAVARSLPEDPDKLASAQRALEYIKKHRTK